MWGCKIYQKWMNSKKIGMTIFVNSFIRSVIRILTHIDIKYHMILDTIFGVVPWTHYPLYVIYSPCSFPFIQTSLSPKAWMWSGVEWLTKTILESITNIVEKTYMITHTHLIPPLIKFSHLNYYCELDMTIFSDLRLLAWWNISPIEILRMLNIWCYIDYAN